MAGEKQFQCHWPWVFSFRNGWCCGDWRWLLTFLESQEYGRKFDLGERTGFRWRKWNSQFRFSKGPESKGPIGNVSTAVRPESKGGDSQGKGHGDRDPEQRLEASQARRCDSVRVDAPVPAPDGGGVFRHENETDDFPQPWFPIRANRHGGTRGSASAMLEWPGKRRCDGRVRVFIGRCDGDPIHENASVNDEVGPPCLPAGQGNRYGLHS